MSPQLSDQSLSNLFNSSTTSSKVFLGVKFSYDKFDIPNGKHVKTINKDSDTKYCYYGVDSSIKGTIYVQLKDNDIKSNDFFGSINIIKKPLKETYELYTNDYSVVLFWIF